MAVDFLIDTGPHTLMYYNEQIYIALFKTFVHFSSFIVRQEDESFKGDSR